MDIDDLIAAMIAAENAYDWDTMGALWAEDAVFVHPGLGELKGREANMKWLRFFASAIDGYHRECFDIVHNGVRGALRFQITGHHTGDLPGLPATGEPVDISGALFFEVSNGQVVRGREVIEHESIRGISLR